MCLVVVILKNQSFYRLTMLRRRDSNPRPLGYEPSELPSATTPLCYPYAKLRTVVFNIRTKKAAILTNSGSKQYNIMYQKNGCIALLSKRDGYRLRQGLSGGCDGSCQLSLTVVRGATNTECMG